MARQIIVLDTQPNQGGMFNVKAVFWFPIAAAPARVPLSAFTSAAANVPSPANVTAGEQGALLDGSVLEEVQFRSYPANITTAAIKADLAALYSQRAAAITALPPTRQYYGVSWDGTTWSA